jgi:hypothetical protein
VLVSKSVWSHNCFIKGADFCVPSHDERDEVGYNFGGAWTELSVPALLEYVFAAQPRA